MTQGELLIAAGKIVRQDSDGCANDGPMPCTKEGDVPCDCYATGRKIVALVTESVFGSGDRGISTCETTVILPALALDLPQGARRGGY